MTVSGIHPLWAATYTRVIHVNRVNTKLSEALMQEMATEFQGNEAVLLTEQGERDALLISVRGQYTFSLNANSFYKGPEVHVFFSGTSGRARDGHKKFIAVYGDEISNGETLTEWVNNGKDSFCNPNWKDNPFFICVDRAIKKSMLPMSVNFIKEP